LDLHRKRSFAPGKATRKDSINGIKFEKKIPITNIGLSSLKIGSNYESFKIYTYLGSSGIK
jgi:hypothetical protein